MTGPRFFQLAWRVSAYEGVMSMRLREQQERGDQPTGQAPRYSTPATRQPSAPAGAGTHEVQEVSLEQFTILFPGMVSRSTVSRSGTKSASGVRRGGFGVGAVNRG
jgi:hypothetical protein